MSQSLSNPRVSVIMPVYNAARTLAASLDSILAQGYGNLEIILVDDGSSDQSLEICRQYARRYGFIKVFSQPNGGPSRARNAALAVFSGELAAFVDSDDILPPDALQEMVRAFQRSDADMVVSGFREIRVPSTSYVDKMAFGTPRLLDRNAVVSYARGYLRKPNRHILFSYVWGRIFRADIIRKFNLSFDEKLSTFEDLSFNYRYLAHVSTVFFVNIVGYYYRYSETYDSATMRLGGNPARMLGFRAALAAISDAVAADSPAEELKREIGHAYVTLSIIQMIRISGQLRASNFAQVYATAVAVAGEPFLQENIKNYSPEGADSRLVPWLMRMRLPFLLVVVCWYKAYRRYGLGGNKK